MPVIHGGGSVELDFNAVASKPVTGVVEPKVCEGCGRPFFRSVPAVRRVVVNGVTIQGGEKFCVACRVKRKLPQSVPTPLRRGRPARVQ